MAAIEYDIVADELRDFNMTFIWYDQFGDQVDLTGYGAIFQVNKEDGTKVARVTHKDNIVIHDPEDVDGEPDDDKGRIDVNVPGANLSGPNIKECRYELVVFPDGDQPTSQPVSLMKGLFKIRPKQASLE